MSKARLKITTTAPRTREEMEALVGEITALKIRERALKAEMDAGLKAVREEFESRLSATTERIAAKIPCAMAWAEAHPDAFGSIKSIEMIHGTIGWRINTPSLRTLAGWTWDRVLEKLRTIPAFTVFIRVKTEVDKQAILSARENFLDGDLREMGVRIAQEEEFYVEPKITDTENRQAISA